MRKSGLLDCVCKYCKYWDQTETCQTGAPRQGQPDIYLANCCWRPSLAHHTILIIHNWAKLCKTGQNCAKLGKTWQNCAKLQKDCCWLPSATHCLDTGWAEFYKNPAESQLISLNFGLFGKNRNLHFLCFLQQTPAHPALCILESSF